MPIESTEKIVPNPIIKFCRISQSLNKAYKYKCINISVFIKWKFFAERYKNIFGNVHRSRFICRFVCRSASCLVFYSFFYYMFSFVFFLKLVMRYFRKQVCNFLLCIFLLGFSESLQLNTS